MKVKERKVLAAEYLKLRRRLSALEKKVKETGGLLKAEALRRGRVDERGTARLQVGDLVVMAVHVIRRSPVEAAVADFQESHPGVVITKRVGDIGAILAAEVGGFITAEERAAMISESEHHSLRVSTGSA